jgi:hypothetical protein
LNPEAVQPKVVTKTVVVQRGSSSGNSSSSGKVKTNGSK